MATGKALTLAPSWRAYLKRLTVPGGVDDDLVVLAADVTELAKRRDG